MAKHKPKYYREADNEKNISPLIKGLIAVMALLVLLSLGVRLLLDRASEPAQVSIQAAEAEVQEPKLSFWERLFGGAKEPTEEAVVQAVEEAVTEPPTHQLNKAVVTVTGDILMHLPVINAGLKDSSGYDFDYMFRYISPYTSTPDLAIANLETTLAGNDAGYKYSGYPAFNCPDEIVDALKHAGFDMLMTANNHCYDTSEYGFLRTVNTIRSKGLETLGTFASVEEPIYSIKEINGIKIGLVCYTYEGRPDNPKAGVTYMNRNAMTPITAALINSFLASEPDSFYLEARQVIEDMKRDGADATVMLIHWGTEYKTAPNTEQLDIAQQLCDLGYDVIVGGHPHVIQPVELLTSRLEPDHKTVCLYSTGNTVSNQRIKEMDLKTGHTEDALLFSMTFTKYSDEDTAYLENVELLPCWVDLRKNEYDIIPLPEEYMEQWQTMFDLTPESYENAKKSFNRTMDLTAEGMKKAQEYLYGQKVFRETGILPVLNVTEDAA